MRAFPQGDGQRAQAAVESAIILPLHIFLLLGIIQWGLIAQARSMAKYAAYRAARVGSMQHADRSKMTSAALFALLPVMSMPVSGGFKGAEYITPTRTTSDVAKKFGTAYALNQAQTAIGLPVVKVVVCGPLKKDVQSASETSYGIGSSDEIDFDDPRVATEGFSGGATLNPVGDPATTGAPQTTSYYNFIRTKLRVQVQFLYRMPIPFANFIISYTYLALQLPMVMRMGAEKAASGAGIGGKHWNGQLDSQGDQLYNELVLANSKGLYVAPIMVNYAMRMQSDYYLNTGNTSLPDSNLCFHYKPS